MTAVLLLGAVLPSPPSEGGTVTNAYEGPITKSRENGLKRVSRLLEALDLDQEQKNRLRAILDAKRADVEDLLERETEARAQMRKAVGQSTVDEKAVREASTLLGAVEGDLANLRAALYEEIAAELSAEQQVRLVQFLVQIEQQIDDRERSVLLLKAVSGDDSLSDEQKGTLGPALDAYRDGLAPALKREERLRQTLLVTILQPSYRPRMVHRALKGVEAMRSQLAAQRADATSRVSGMLTDEQLRRLRKKASAADKAIVERHRVATLLFLDLL